MENLDEMGEAFSTAVAVALREMASAEAALTDTRADNGTIRPGRITAILRLVGRGEGFLVLSMPAVTATAMARRVLAGTTTEVDQVMVQDCVGEVANIIAGQAKTLLYGTPHHFSFSPPITDGSQALPDVQWLSLSFVSDVGDLTLQVHLP